MTFTTRTISNTDLVPGMEFAIDGVADGGLLIEDVRESSALPGLLALTVEMGTLYVDKDLESVIIDNP